jgi:ribulose-bisphosphate carboxylase small chain
MWGLPMFDLPDAVGVLHEIHRCRRACPDSYIRVSAYDSRQGRQTIALSFLVNRPTIEPGFRLDRQEAPGRRIRTTIHPYALDQPPGARYEPI